MEKKHIIIVGITALIISGVAYNTFLKPKQETITVSGAFALYPLMIQWSEEYQEINPNVKFEISAGGAGKGMTDALSDLVDLGMVSRNIYEEEIEKGAVYVAVAKDAVVVTFNAENPVIEQILEQGVTTEQLIEIFITGEITIWGELVGDPENTDTINIYTRSDACGAAETFANYLGYHQEDLLGVGVYGDPGLAEAVKTDVYSIGYNNVNYAYDLSTNSAVEGVLVIPLDLNEDGTIQTSEYFYSTRDEIIEAIADDRYPSPPSRDLYLVTKDEFTGATLDFVEWVLTTGQGSATEAGYVPLSAERAASELEKLE